jgi:hypothetical protein
MFAQFQDTFNRFITGEDAPAASTSSPNQSKQYEREKRSLVSNTGDFSDDDDTILPILVNNDTTREESILPPQLSSFMSNLTSTIQSNVSTIRQNITGVAPVTTTTTVNETPVTRGSSSSATTTQQPTDTWSTFSTWKDSARTRLETIIGVEEERPPEPRGWLDGMTGGLDEYTTLSKTNRLYGCLICLGIGALCIFIAIGFLPSILLTSRAFAFFYTIGNICLVSATFFLVGPMRQMRMMLEKDRIIPSLSFISSLVLTMLAAVVLQSALLVLILIVVQIISLGYYILSYIPFGQQIASSFITAISTAFRAMF